MVFEETFCVKRFINENELLLLESLLNVIILINVLRECIRYNERCQDKLSLDCPFPRRITCLTPAGH